MIETLIATVVMVVGVVGVAQLIPMSIRMNAGNRDDSTALVFAQRELDEMVDQPMSATTFSDPQGVLCPPAANCNLGNAATPKVPVGSPVVMFNNRPMIDFTEAAVANYSFNYTDPERSVQIALRRSLGGDYVLERRELQPAGDSSSAYAGGAATFLSCPLTSIPWWKNEARELSRRINQVSRWWS